MNHTKQKQLSDLLDEIHQLKERLSTKSMEMKVLEQMICRKEAEAEKLKEEL